MRKIYMLPVLLLAGCATWGTHIKTAGTLAEHLSAECGGLEKKAQEKCIADELARWAECAAETRPADADTDGDTDGPADPGE
jgi:hypothetical protein